MSQESMELDVSRLGRPSRVFFDRLMQRLPEIASYARMVQSDEGDLKDLLIEIPSPTGDADRTIIIWMNEGTEASVEFGEEHTHATCEVQTNDLNDEADAIIDLVKAILADEVVLFYDCGGEYDGHCGWLDLRLPDAVLDEITSKFSPGRVRIATWSGAGDREVGIEDLSES